VSANAPDAAVWRAVLVDDERLARKRLRSLLAEHPEIETVGEARDLAAARRLIHEEKPDVVFLDIQLGPDEGFDLLPDVARATEVVFVTAHDEFAVRAFEVNALDYLLKPVLPGRLAASLARLRAKRAGAPPRETPVAAQRLQVEDPLVLRDGRTWRKLEIAQVAAICGEGTYTRLFMAGGESLLLTRTLAQWAAMLPGEFVRLSRSVLVNLTRIERWEVVNRNRSYLHLYGLECPLRLGRVASRQLRQRLKEGVKE